MATGNNGYPRDGDENEEDMYYEEVQPIPESIIVRSAGMDACNGMYDLLYKYTDEVELDGFGKTRKIDGKVQKRLVRARDANGNFVMDTHDGKPVYMQ